jgi:hypothetical protein
MGKNEITRRFFIMSSAAIAAGCATGTKFRAPRKVSANDKLNIAGVGVGGKGESDVAGAAEGNNVVALCDVDWKKAAKSFHKFPNATQYNDFRVMLDKEHKNIDAVTVSTADHMHAAIAVAAMQLGKHVYVQKPLTHDIYEARRLTQLARQYKVATQMGNQGHSGDGVRRLTEWIAAGAIGKVHEVHIWTNRPIWPQGMDAYPAKEEIPSTLNWKAWLGTAPDHDYNHVIMPFAWRGWWDFGCGALGDMGCHIIDPAYTTLKLGYPTSVEPIMIEKNTAVAAPVKSTLVYQFPARGDMPPVKVMWFDGEKNLPPRPEGVGADETLGDGGENGSIFYGDKGVLTCGCYGDSPRLLPKEKMKDFQKPPRSIPSSAGHYKEWINACKGIMPEPGNFCGNFDYAGPFTEVVNLGNLAVRAGQKIEFDPASMKVTNFPEADKYIRRTYRKEYQEYA